MENLDYTKLFDVGERVTLSSDFLDYYYSPDSWEQDCINAQTKYGSLKIKEVRQGNIKVEGIKSNWSLQLYCINLYQLEPYRDNHEVLYTFANNQAEQGRKRNVSHPLNKAFNWNNTPERYDFWEDIYTGKYPKSKESIKTLNNNQQEITQNNNNHEIRLQKQKASIIRSTRPEGSRIRSSEHKASIRSRQISYTACHC